MRHLLAIVAATSVAGGAWAQERTLGDFRLTTKPSEATRTDDLVAAYEQRDIGFALRCIGGQQGVALQIFGSQARAGTARVGDGVRVQLRVDEGDILDVKATIAAIAPDRVEVTGGDSDTIARLANAGRLGVRYTLGNNGPVTSILVFNDLEAVVKAVQRACRPKA